MQEIEFKLADNSVMSFWLIDRIASGFTYPTVKAMYQTEFTQDLSELDFNDFKIKNQDAVEARFAELKDQVRDSGVVAKLISITDKLYKEINTNPDLSARELASISDTLRKYLETLNNLNKSAERPRDQITNNFLVLKGLAEEGLLTITNEDKLKRYVDADWQEEN